MSKQYYMSIDIETTGLSPKRDHILSIGATFYDVNEENEYYEIASFDEKCYAHSILGDKTATALIINSLYNESTDESPCHDDFLSQNRLKQVFKSEKELLNCFFIWVNHQFQATNNKVYLIGQHIYFDLSFLNEKLYKYFNILDFNDLFQRPYIDVKLIGFLNGEKDTSLNGLATKMLNESQPTPHNALSDARLTAKLYFKGFKNYKDQRNGSF